MSEETAGQLEEARASEASTRAEVDLLKQKFLDSIANEVPERVEKLAKEATQRELNVAKSLGVDGITELRSELAAEAADIAADLASASDRIEWPGVGAAKQGVHAALFKYLYGAKLDKLSIILQRRGFDFRPTAQSGRSVLPQNLYSQDTDEFAELAQALHRLGSAERKVKEAETAADRDAVESLWRDSES